MRVLVTGGAGFIGSHTVEALLARGDEVTVLDSFDDAYDPAIKAHNLDAMAVFCAPRARLVRGDIRDPVALADALEGVDAVVHLAARAGVRHSLRDPGLYTSVNIVGLGVLLDALRLRPGVPLVFASSSSVYGSSERAPFREDAAADRPMSPYAATKRAGELLCHAAHAGWGLAVTALRFFTVYGPRQRPDMAISLFLRRALAGAPLPVYGDLGAARDYTWVGDTVAGVLAAVDQPHGFAVINLGSGQPVGLGELTEAIAMATGRPVELERLPPQAGDVPLTHADNRLAAELLGWRPKMALADGLAATAGWMRGPRV